MAQDTTKHTIEIGDNGTAKDTEKKIKDLEDVIRRTSKEARDAKKEIKSLLNEGGTAGSRAISEAAAIRNYSKQRGVASLTGAEGRDFAAQAQGLDGLVRLYATYAANVFALGAAFRGLGQAMDTRNMVEGLNQLGASVGRNLGGLSARVSELTGGAISMREAMQAVALTSSGGMTAKNIERLAGVARSASLALGVNMPDAISRLSRGITKLEPELLDELGIMTRLEPATQAYARELGKTVTQLTEFERRQAFANAVLAEGEAKFGAITNLETNPYDKLVSSLKNLAQEGAQVINKVLAPIANFLSGSPAILGGGVLALISSIIKSALPEIGEFRSRLAESVNAAAELAKTRANEANEAELRMTRVAKQQAEERAAAQFEATARAEQAITNLRNKNLREYKAATSVLNKLNVIGSTIDEADIIALESAAKKREHAGKSDEAKVYREVAKAVKDYTISVEQAASAVQRHQAAILKQEQSKEFTIASLTRQLAIKAEEESIKKAIISNAAYNASLIGITQASTIMKAEINAANLALTTWGKTVLMAQGYAAMFAGVISTLGNAFIKLTNAVAWVGTIIAIFSIVDNVFSGTRKELDRFNKSIDSVSASVENVDRTVAHLERTMTAGTLNGIISMGNALEDLNSNFTDLIENSRAARKELASGTGISGAFNRLKNSIASGFGGGIDNNLNKPLIESIRSSIRLLSKSGLKEEATAEFKKILDVDSLDVDSINEALKRLSSDGLKKLQESLSNATRELTNSGSRMQTFKQSLDASTRAYQQFIQATSNTSPLFRVGAALENLGVSMFQSSQNIKLGLNEINAAINHISEVPDAGNIFGLEFIEELVVIREEFMSNNKAISAYKNALEELDKQISGSKFASLIGESQEDLKNRFLGGSDTVFAEIEKLKKLSKSKEEIENSVTLLSEQQSEKARKLFMVGLDSAFNRGAELIRVSFGQALEKGAIAIGRAALAGLTGADRARQENALAKQELDIQLRAIQTNIDLILSNALLRASLDRLNASSNLRAAREAGASQQEIKALESVSEASEIFYKIIREGQMPNFSNLSRFTNDEDVATRVRVNSIADSQRIAEQREAKVLLDAQRTALSVSGAINVRSGTLEDNQKLITLQQQIIQNDSQRVNLVKTLTGLSSQGAVLEQEKADRSALLLKQHIELLAVDTAIANASGGEVEKQKEFKLLTLARHERELELQHLTSSQRVIQATMEILGRQLELTRAINDNTYRRGIAETDLLTAQNNAYNNLYGVSTGFAATQAEIVGTQRAQLEYVKLLQEAQLAFYEKERKAKEDIARLDPNTDAAAIAEVNTELERQASITEMAIENAKVQLTTQQKILEVNREAALQQDRYNRILNNSTKAATSMAKAFGNFGSSLGLIAEAFGTMTVNADKNFNELARIRKQLAEVGDDEAARARLDREYNIQRNQYTQDQLIGYGSIAGAAKNLFEEQSAGYRILMAIEKAMYIAHVAMSLKQLAVDAMTSKASMAMDVAEAETSGVLAVVKTIAGLPPPFNIIAGVAVAGLITALLASIGGSGPKVSGTVPGGSTSEEAQAVQGTGRRYVNGKLQDISGGALGSTEKVNDIALSLDLIQNNTSITSSYAVKTIDTLKQIERNTKSVAAEAFKSTNIGKLTSGFGTIEKALPATGAGGLLSGLFPTSSKSTEIIDKGISVMGKFSEILAGTANLLEFETVKTTKTKSGFLGFGGKTKVKINTNTKELSQQAEETVVDLFSSLAFATISASKQVLGEANKEIEKVLEDFTVSFKASGMGLSGEEFAEAILAESSVVMNQIIEQALPQFEEFRQLGEGFTSTLLRMATTVDVVTERMSMLLNTDFKSTVEQSFKFSSSILNNISEALASYTSTLDTVIIQAIGTGNAEIPNNILDQFWANIYGGIAGSSVPEETGLQLNIDQITAITEAENNLAIARNKIIEDLGLSNLDMVQNLNSLQNAYTNAKVAILNNIDAQKDFATVNKLISGELQLSSNDKVNAKLGINDEIKTLYKLTLDLEKATNTVSEAFKDQTFLTMVFYDTLVEGMGGLEAFTEKTGFFFSNFFSDSEQLAAKTAQVNQSLSSFATEGILTAEQLSTLTDGVGNLRMEFREITLAQNLFTESGREAFNTLITFAPAIAEISDVVPDAITGIGKSINELLDQFNLSAQTFTDIFTDAILGDSALEELGAEIANTIRNGYLEAISSSFIDNLSTSFVDNIIAPILSSTMSWTTSDYMKATGNFTDFISTLTQNATNLSNMLSNPIFNEAINQATTVATTAITKLTTTLKNSDKIFSNSKLLDYTNELKELQEEFKTTTLQDAIEAEQTRLDLLEEQADVLKNTAENLKNFNSRILDFKKSLLIGPKSPLTPLDQYATAKSQLEQAFSTAAMAASEEDRSAAREKIEELSTTFLDVSRSVFSSGSQYTKDFDFVQSILDSLITDTGVQLSIAEQQLSALNTQIDASKETIKLLEEQIKSSEEANNSLETIATRIAELTDLIALEYQKGKDAVANSFTILDSNVDNLLTLEELKSSGIASDETLDKYFSEVDSNGDGQLSRLEALLGTSTSTLYTIQSIIPIFEAVKEGIGDMNVVMSLIAELNAANIAKGGAPISGEYLSPSGTGLSLSTNTSPKYTSSTGGYIQDGMVYGTNGSSMALKDAKNVLLDLVDDVNSGALSAKTLYDGLKNWGVNSGTVASVLGVAKDEVLSWFKSKDSSIPAFAKGIDLVPEDMLAQIHKNERIMPAADNALLMQSLSNRNDTNIELINELKQLNIKIEELQGIVAQGAIMNVEATNKNTEEISKSVEETSLTNNHIESMQRRAAIR